MPAPNITPLPTPPSRSTDPINFAIEADAFVAALPDFATEANAQADYLDGLAAAVDADAAIAEASASIAAGAANYQGDYNAGTTYQIGESVSYSGGRYIAKTVNTGVTPVDGANWLVIAAPSSAVNYPQNSQSANYTLVLADAGKQIFHPASDTISRVYTIPSNASVPFTIGTVILFTVENGGASVSVAINSDTLVLGSGVTGTAPVSPNNTLMAIKVTATKWMASYLNQEAPTAPYVFAVVTSTAPYVDAYPFTSGVGFGVRYANPATAISGAALSIDFAPSGNAVAFGLSGSPYLEAYQWSGNGFGARYANPATLPTFSGVSVAFSSQENAIASVNGSSSPNLEAWRWDSNTGFGTKYGNPATVTFSATRAVVFHPSDTAVAVSNSNSPFINAYAWTSASGFGTKFANPATLPVSTGFGVSFSPAGDAIAVTNGGSPAITVYAWNGSGFGSKYTNPATLPTGSYASAFTPNGDTIAVADIGSPYIRAYPFNSATGFGTIYANPATLPPAAANDIASTYNF